MLSRVCVVRRTEGNAQILPNDCAQKVSNLMFLLLTAIVDDLDEDAAATVFQQAMQEGKAMCGKY